MQWLIIVLFSFCIGSLLDGIFLRKTDDGSKLTFLGKGFFISLFFIFVNFPINTIRYPFTKKKDNYEWNNFLKVPKKRNYYVSFAYASLYFFLEIVFGFIISLILVPNLLENMIDLNWISELLIIFMLISFTVYLFFKALPYKKKTMPYKILSLILLGISIILFILRGFKII